MKAYKLFKIKDGHLFPLYVNASAPVPMGIWLEAKAGPMAADGKHVKSRLGNLAFRPGWHCSDYPVALHIGEKENPKDKLPSYRPRSQVWAEVEVMDRVNWQQEANKQGKNPRDKQLKVIPVNGYYEYKTNPNMYGRWIIAGNIRVNRILSDEEVRQINSKIDVEDLPRKAA